MMSHLNELLLTLNQQYTIQPDFYSPNAGQIAPNKVRKYQSCITIDMVLSTAITACGPVLTQIVSFILDQTIFYFQ